MTAACSVHVRGVVQGVGFRPFVFRLARAHTLAGWVRNGDDGVEIHVEGPAPELEVFLRDLREQAPRAAVVTTIDVSQAEPTGLDEFAIRDSGRSGRPTTRIVPDLAVCEQCLAELFDRRDRRWAYPYINCTNCGPRYSVIRDLPYDRARTTMAAWPLDSPCAAEFDDPADRRFNAQPLACPACGPGYRLLEGRASIADSRAAIGRAAALLARGAIVAVKGIGGFHLACDAANAASVRALRERKFRKEKAFALMARDIGAARRLVALPAGAEAVLESVARPIVLAPARVELPGVAPDHDELGVMLPYAPLHHLLFAGGAPDVLVMTSANRSSEPIAFEDDDALTRLEGLADAFLIGERPIARRVDDSVVRVDAQGPIVLRRGRGYAPDVVAIVPAARPLLAVGGDLKNAVTLVVGGQAFVGQHIGDLDQADCRRAFRETMDDLLRMFAVDRDALIVAHDAHPEYASTLEALELPAQDRRAIQHHRAHVASVLAERGAWDLRVLGVALDGTGFGDDGTIWGGELFVGSVREGFERVGHLRPALLPGGDAAAKHPVQAAAGFLAGLDGVPDLCAPPFDFPPLFHDAGRLARRGVRTFATTSMGRLFDTAAAIAGFTRPVTFEGQAAMWLEQLARRGDGQGRDTFDVPYRDGELDFRPLLAGLIEQRRRGRSPAHLARVFHRSIACGLAAAMVDLCARHRLRVAAISGGVFQNALLVADLKAALPAGLQLWMNRHVPPNDGGLSLGQAALAALAAGEAAR